ncbi:MAG: hypothetical protein V1911_04475 [Candidatus Micrarchaeota archaeon]
MPVTQIVSVRENKDAVIKSLQKISTSKLVFAAASDEIEKVVALRNEFAIDKAVSTEVLGMGKSIEEICKSIKSYENPVVHIIDHSYMNYYLIAAAHVAGIPVYFTNGNGVEELPMIKSSVKTMLSDEQASILHSLEESPMSVNELQAKIGCDESRLFHCLYARKPANGLVQMGLINDDELLQLTELGRCVLNS